MLGSELFDKVYSLRKKSLYLVSVHKPRSPKDPNTKKLNCDYFLFKFEGIDSQNMIQGKTLSIQKKGLVEVPKIFSTPFSGAHKIHKIIEIREGTLRRILKGGQNKSLDAKYEKPLYHIMKDPKNLTHSISNIRNMAKFFQTELEKQNK